MGLNFKGSARAEKRFVKAQSINNINSKPITQRASSPLKINEALVAGAADVNKKFTDIGAAVSEGFKDAAPEPIAADLSGNKKDKDKDKDPTVKDEGTGFTATGTGSMFSKFL